jgi:hypothetical protein
MPDEHKEVEAILGPYRGQRLTMTAADATAAINAHWARDPFTTEEPHDPLSEEERTAALDAANAWYDAQQAAASGEAPPPEPPPEGGEAQSKRAMAAEKPGAYTTRETAKPKR